MRIDLDPNASTYLRQRHYELINDPSLPLITRRMISVHLAKPWIPGFWSVAIKSGKPGGDQSYIDFPIGTTNRAVWFFPSRQWWEAHSKASHPPDGSGCDVSVHTKFLSKEGKIHEFDYATISTDGELTVLGRKDFVEECAFWKRAFVATR